MFLATVRLATAVTDPVQRRPCDVASNEYRPAGTSSLYRLSVPDVVV